MLLSLPSASQRILARARRRSSCTGFIPPANGDATGIEPISGRHVVYVAQGGQLQIYDTTTDKLQPKQIDISGEVIDVKVVDF